MLCADKLVKLSYDMVPGDPVPDGIPEASVQGYKDIPHDGGNVRILSTSSHTGTHVDSPNHMLEDGYDIFHFGIRDFLFDAPCLIDVPLGDDGLVRASHFEPLADQIKSCDFLLIRTGWAEVRRQDGPRYAAHSPGFSLDAAEWIAANCPNIRAIGADFLSFAAPMHVKEGVEAHKIMMRAQKEIQLYEDLYLPPASELQNGDLCQVLSVPWLFVGADSAPCTVYGIRKD